MAVGSGSGSGSGGGEDGCVEGPCPQAGCAGCVSPKIFLSDLFPEMNFFGGLFDATVGNCGNAELDNGGGAGDFFGLSLTAGAGC